MNSTLTAAADAELDRQLRLAGPMNIERAYEVMDELNLSGMVLGDPLNVFHALGYWPQLASTKAGQPATSFALISRNPKTARGFVTTHFIHYYTWADAGFQGPLQVWLYQDAGDDGLDLAVEPPQLCVDRGLLPLSNVEARRRRVLNAVPLAQQSLRDAGAALVTAMQEMDMWRGNVAYDDAAIAAVCGHHDFPGRLLHADNILRRIRIIKSPLEIALMRRAAAANVAAVHAVAQGVRAGASYRELRQLFDLESARRGNRAVFLTLDRVSSELSDDRIVDGQVLFIDGVSGYRRYHGDYARTIFVGAPSVAAKRATDAATVGWNAVRECLRPGLRYSEISRIGAEAVRAAGSDVQVGFGPHSVGLMHTDEPGEETQGFYRKADLVLKPNMILSVDCPVMSTGVGGSAHLEDLMLITANGAEPLHAINAPVIQL